VEINARFRSRMIDFMRFITGGTKWLGGITNRKSFVTLLGAFIQAARSVTYMLQKESSVFKDLNWYKKWAEKAKIDSLLKWLNDTRVDFVHRQSLEPHSWLRVHCLGIDPTPHVWDDEEEVGVFSFVVSPFYCTHYYIATGISTDHAHEFERFWAIDSLPGKELLEVCADIYDRLDDLVHEAHRQAGASMSSHKREGSVRSLPCMEDVLKHRVVQTILKDGREVWENEPPGLHSH
jgi:hypothetical protein